MVTAMLKKNSPRVAVRRKAQTIATLKKATERNPMTKRNKLRSWPTPTRMMKPWISMMMRALQALTCDDGTSWMYRE